MKLKSMIIGAAALLAGVFSVSTLAAYPQKPVTAICPWTVGGGTDILLRALSREAAKYLGQPINVRNETGASGAIGHHAIRAAHPDGYTVGIITLELNSMSLQGIVNFTWKDFDLLMMLNDDPAALTVPKDAPYNTVAEFVDYAKAHPGEISIGNSAPGSAWHIAAGLTAEKTGIKVIHVPFDGAQPAVTALLHGHIQAVTVSVAEVRGQVHTGALKILGIMSAERDRTFPDVPTFRQQGVDVVFSAWRGLALPKGVPADIKAKISNAYKKAFDSREFQEFAAKASLNLKYMNAADFAKFLNQSYKNVEAVTKSLNLGGACRY